MTTELKSIEKQVQASVSMSVRGSIPDRHRL